MHNRVSAPRPPGFTGLEHAPGILFVQRFHYGQIGVGKGVRPSQRPHRNVLRRPLTDAGYRLKLLHRFGYVDTRRQVHRAFGQEGVGPLPLGEVFVQVPAHIGLVERLLLVARR